MTISVSNAASITGGSTADVITLLDANTVAVNGGTSTAGSVLVLAKNGVVANVNGGISSVVTTGGSIGNSVNFNVAAVASVTDVSSVVGSTGNDTLTDTISVNVTDVPHTYLLTGGASGNDSLTLQHTGTTGGGMAAVTFTDSIVSGSGNDVINLSNAYYKGVTVTAVEYNVVVSGAGADTITLAAGTGTTGITTVVSVVRTNLNDYVGGSVLLTTADDITNMNFTGGVVVTAGTHGLDKINLAGVNLVQGSLTTVGYSTDVGTGGTNYTAYTASGVNTAFNNIGGSGALAADVIFIDTSVVGTRFTAQAGITAAVSAITSNFAGATVGQNAVIAMTDGIDTALFHFVAATAGAVTASELTLVGVIHGQTGITASNFS